MNYLDWLLWLARRFIANGSACIASVFSVIACFLRRILRIMTQFTGVLVDNDVIPKCING